MFHWGDGTLFVGGDVISLEGEIAPGPDYKLSQLKDFAEHEDEFLPLKAQALQLGDVKSFNGFILDVPDSVDLTRYTTVLIWCEAFSEFITAAKYR